MATYGYVRVSTADQNEDRQMMAMDELKIPAEQIYMDKLSGKDFQRPAYIALTDKLRPGDLLYIKSIDRLGRNYDGDVKHKLKKSEIIYNQFIKTFTTPAKQADGLTPICLLHFIAS